MINYTDTHLRGNQLLSPKQFVHEVQKEREEAGQQALYPFFSGIHLPQQALSRNFLFAGTPSSGKSTLMMLAMESLLRRRSQNLEVQKVALRAVIHDHAGDMVPLLANVGFTVGNGLRILNPFDRRGVRWNMAADISNTLFARELVEHLIPTQKDSSADPFWRQSAQEILLGVICSFIKMRPGQWRFADILDACLHQGINGLIECLSWSKQNISRVRKLQDSESVTVAGILKSLEAELEKYLELAAAWELCSEDFTIQQFLEEESIILLGSYESAHFQLEMLNRLFLSRLADVLLTKESFNNDQLRADHTLLFLDEAALLGKLEKLPKLLDAGRKKGVVVFFAFHDLAQLHKVYGKELAQSILAKFGNVALLFLNDQETRQWASDLFGEEEVLREWIVVTDNQSSDLFHSEKFSPWSNSGQSRAYNQQVLTKKLVLPSEFGDLPSPCPRNGLQGFFLVKTDQVRRVKGTIPWGYIEEHFPKGKADVSALLLRDLNKLDFQEVYGFELEEEESKSFH